MEQKTPLSKPARRLRRKTQTQTIQKWVKQNLHNFKQEDHGIQVVYDITTIKKETGEAMTKSYHTDTLFVFGGKFKIRRAI